MRGVTLHIVLADRVIGRWREGSGAPPLDVDDPVALNAFYHGAVGPDLGYFPGGCRLLSDLAHCVRTAALTRTLLGTAATTRERAFAMGWLTHFLGDALIHPLIGRAVGELLTGSRSNFVDGSSDLLAHLRVEMGLDAWYAARHPEVRGRRLAVSMRLVGGLMGPRRAGVMAVLRGALGAVYRVAVFRSTTLAYLNPVEPSLWLLETVGRAAARHAELFLDHCEDGAATLQDLNLDTGRPLSSERHHEGTRRTLAALARLAA